MTKKSKEVQNTFWCKVTLFQLLLSVMIVIYHSNVVSTYSAHGLEVNKILYAVCEWFTNSFAGYVVTFFIFVSGVLFYRNIDVSALREKLQSRVRTLLVPYVAWNVIFFIDIIVIQIIPYIVAYGNFNIGYNISDIIKGLTIRPFDDALWTVFTLIIYTVCSPVIFLLVKNKRIGFATIVIFWIMRWLGVGLPVNARYQYAFAWYITGAYLGKHYFWIFSKCLNGWYWYVANIAVILFASFSYKMDFLQNLLAYDIVGVCLAVSLFNVLDLVVPIMGKYVGKLRGLSFWIYAMHELCLEWINKWWITVWEINHVALIINTVLIPIAIIAVCIFTYWILQRYAHRLWCVLSGGRGG
jgi:hypothetical protein